MTGNIVALVMQLPAAVLIAFVPLIRPDNFNLIMGVSYVGCALLILPVREVYTRTAHAQGAGTKGGA